MESSEFYSEMKAKGLQLANHDGKLRVGPKEKLTKEDRELLKVLKEELLALPAMKMLYPESEHSVRCEPNSRVFYREKRHILGISMSFLPIKDFEIWFTTYTMYTFRMHLHHCRQCQQLFF